MDGDLGLLRSRVGGWSVLARVSGMIDDSVSLLFIEEQSPCPRDSHASFFFFSPIYALCIFN